MKTKEKIKKIRLKKIENFKKREIEVYPQEIKKHKKIKEVIDNFFSLTKEKKGIVLVGRIRTIRTHGAITFLHFEDETGRIQSCLRKNLLTDYYFFLENIDIGDFVLFEGKLFLTKKGEKTIEVEKWQILAKSLSPLPEKWHGLSDIEERFRKRYLDLLINKEIKEKFILKSKIISFFRNYLEKNDFIEAETPILQPIYGGASAQPFKTHHKAFDLKLYLRIAPELYLKRLLIGGFERVFEIGRNFRNEGVDASHNPDFTSLEFYQAYHDYKDLMEFLEKMLEELVLRLFKKKEINWQGKKISFSLPFKRIKFYDIIKKEIGIDPQKLSEKEIKDIALKYKIPLERKSKAETLDDFFKKICLKKIIEPTFVIHHPIELTPLAKATEENPLLAARFQLIIGGWEIANAFSELNDPIEQEKRFLEQLKKKKNRKLEIHPFDKDFIEALSYGMPPAAGCGLGIDRFTALLTNSKTLREVILFPLMKPLKN